MWGKFAPHFLFLHRAPRYNVKEDLEAIVRSSLAPLGLDIFELRQRGRAQRPIVDVRVERADGGDVTVDDCATASRAIETRLDADGSLGQRYVLEVSSPGVERPLRGPDDWRRFTGRTAVVTSEALGGTAEVEILGVEDTPAGGSAVVRTTREGDVRVPFDAIRKARLAFHWKR
jgi:ribosome maturation factor RimP